MGTKDRISEGTVESLLNLNKHGWDIYFIPNKVANDFVGVKPSDKDIQVYTRIVVDLDPITANDITSGREFFSKATSRSLDSGMPGQLMYPAPHIVYTGNGVQLHYDVNYHLGISNREISARAAAFLRSFTPTFDGLKVDSCMSDLSRMVRFPNTYNWKTGILGSVLISEKVNNNINLMLHNPPANVPIVPTLLVDADLTNLSKVAPRLTGRAARFLMEGETESRHQGCYAAAACLRDLGVAQDTALEWIQKGAKLCAPKPTPFTEQEVIHCVRTAYKN